MRRLTVLVAALLLPAGPPLLLGTAIGSGTLLISQGTAQAQSAEAVAKIAQAITVRIEGATQGSGVLVKRDGNRYTVLTVWHVVSGQRPGEELEIYTPDGQRYQLEQGSIKRIGDVDLAVLTFTSTSPYQLARIGEAGSVSMGSPIYVSGFPLATSAVPLREMRFLDGKVIANASVTIPNGYQLLYSNLTLPGMSGGAVLNAQGQLIGIHGQGELDSKMTEQQGIAVKTGTSQAVPIAYYSKDHTGAAITTSPTKAITADDYLAQAAYILSKGLKQGADNKPDFLMVIELVTASLRLNANNADAYGMRARARNGIGEAKEALDDATRALSLDPANWHALFARANMKYASGDTKGAIADYNSVIAINPQSGVAYSNRGVAKSDLGDQRGAIADFSQAIAINPQDADSFNRRGGEKFELGDKQGALADYNQAIAINPQYAIAYYNRGIIKNALGDKQGAIADYSQSIRLDPQDRDGYVNRGIIYEQLEDLARACADWRSAASLGHADAANWVRKQCQ